jgi:hypothetical protein
MPDHQLISGRPEEACQIFFQELGNLSQNDADRTFSRDVQSILYAIRAYLIKEAFAGVQFAQPCRESIQPVAGSRSFLTMAGVCTRHAFKHAGVGLVTYFPRQQLLGSIPSKTSGTVVVSHCPFLGRPGPGRGSGARSAMPAEFLCFALRTQAELDVDQGGAGEVHCLVESRAQVLWLLDVGAVAAESLHHLVVARSPDQ